MTKINTGDIFKSLGGSEHLSPEEIYRLPIGDIENRLTELGVDYQTNLEELKDEILTSTRRGKVMVNKAREGGNPSFVKLQLEQELTEKKVLAKWAVDGLPNELGLRSGAGVFLDAGSSSLEVWFELRNRISDGSLNNLNIATNSFLIMKDYIDQQGNGNCELRNVGKTLDIDHECFYEDERFEEGFRPNIVYIGIAGIEFSEAKGGEFRIGYHSRLEHSAKEHVFACPTKARVLLGTPSKIGYMGAMSINILSLEKLDSSAPIYLVSVKPDENSEWYETYEKSRRLFGGINFEKACKGKGIEFHWIPLEPELDSNGSAVVIQDEVIDVQPIVGAGNRELLSTNNQG